MEPLTLQLPFSQRRHLDVAARSFFFFFQLIGPKILALVHNNSNKIVRVNGPYEILLHTVMFFCCLQRTTKNDKNVPPKKDARAKHCFADQSYLIQLFIVYTIMGHLHIFYYK